MAKPRPASLISHVVTLVAFALFAIEIAVLVPFTYLYWQRLVPAPMFDWQMADAFCKGLKLAGYSGWRLPTRIELVSIQKL